MKQIKKRSIFFHTLFMLVITLIIVNQGQTVTAMNNDALKLTVELTDSNKIQLSWKTVFEANYYKVFRATVTPDTEPTADDVKYIELGVSETNEFSDNLTKDDGENIEGNTIKEKSSYLYYVVAIDAWEKEIEKSEVVKFNFPLKLEDIK